MARNIKSSKELKDLPAYELVKEQWVGDCKATGLVFRHKKSGARVCVLSNDDDNKVFCMAFKTPSRDDTGVAHILEHSVLCGSEKYPVKDPFMELEKGSLNTFLNAYTFSDKTCYPVASCNDKDFENLCGVYADACLKPLIYSRKEIFMQEGWHYEIDSKEAPLTVNGVVFNEMKGAFSSPESRILKSAIHSVFPDNSYRFESGGLPAAIPTLTYEAFLDFHRSYYHPANSYIYFYGDVDVESRLEWLDREYLSQYEAISVNSSIGLQKPVGTRDITSFYPLGSEESEENASYLTWASVAGDGAEAEKLIAISIILDVLFSIPGAPAKEALVEAGVGQDISASLYSELQQSLILLMAMNTEAEKMDDFKRILKEQFEKAAKEGLNKQSISAVLNRMEFAQAEADFGNTPKGLVYIEDSLSTWLYNEEDPFSALDKLTIFENLKKKIDTGYFENLILECILKDDNSVYITTKPSKTLGQEESDKITDRLAEIKAGLTEEQLEQIIAEKERLDIYQAEPSTKEELETIPMLSREDIPIKNRPIISAEETVGGVKLYSHDYETNGIIYLRLFFELSGVPDEKLEYVPFSTRLFGDMDTSKHSYLDLNNELNTHTGGVGMSVSTFNRRGADKYYRPVLSVDVKLMKDELDNVLPLLKEFLFDTSFKSKKRLREIIGEANSELKYVLNRSSHLVAMNEARGNVSPEFAFLNKVKGLSERRFIDKLIKCSDEELDQVISEVESLANAIIGRDNMFMDVICNAEIYSEIKDKLGLFASEMRSTDGSCKATADFCGKMYESKPGHKAYKNSGTVNYLAFFGNYSGVDDYLAGKISVASQIISNEYLYGEIRVKGGAYGCGFIDMINGLIGGFYSYRDPHIAETLEVYKGVVDFLKNFDADDREMFKYIIGTVGMYIAPMGPKAKGVRSLKHTLAGTTIDRIESAVRGVLETSVQDIRDMASVLEEILRADNYCAVGSESEVTKNADMFDSIESLL